MKKVIKASLTNFNDSKSVVSSICNVLDKVLLRTNATEQEFRDAFSEFIDSRFVQASFFSTKIQPKKGNKVVSPVQSVLKEIAELDLGDGTLSYTSLGNNTAIIRMQYESKIGPGQLNNYYRTMSTTIQDNGYELYEGAIKS